MCDGDGDGGGGGGSGGGSHMKQFASSSAAALGDMGMMIIDDVSAEVEAKARRRGYSLKEFAILESSLFNLNQDNANLNIS